MPYQRRDQTSQWWVWMGMKIPAVDQPQDRAKRFCTLLRIYDGLLGALDDFEVEAEWMTHPDVSALKWRLERDWLRELKAADYASSARDETNTVATMRKLAARNRIPEVYNWIAKAADRDQVLAFIAAEGGPDGGFDDLVAVAQLGITGEAKLELATNYWDEMGNGELEAMHTDLHRMTSETLGLKHSDRTKMSERALERAAFGGLLATNHWLQPEMLGALGMIELQAGPRCQQVLKGMRRCELPEVAQTFYRVHAEVDPRHGADWLAHVVGPMSVRMPHWRHRILRGAQWRIALNDAFLVELHQDLISKASQAA